MRLGQLSGGDFAARLAGPGIGIQAGAFAFRIRSDALPVERGIRLLYEDYPLVEAGGFCDYAVEIRRRSGLRRHVRPQVQFLFDGDPVFDPLPLLHALPLAEWALTWCVSTYAHQHLVLHAAVVDRDGRAAILPAPPGSGTVNCWRSCRRNLSGADSRASPGMPGAHSTSRCSSRQTPGYSARRTSRWPARPSC
jgi:hypothetical protein